jgi:hypothetical protein
MEVGLENVGPHEVLDQARRSITTPGTEIARCSGLSIAGASPHADLQRTWLSGDTTSTDVNRGGVTGPRKTTIVSEATGVGCEVQMAGLAIRRSSVRRRRDIGAIRRGPVGARHRH